MKARKFIRQEGGHHGLLFCKPAILNTWICAYNSQHFFRKLGVLKISINSQSTQDVQPETTNNKKETDRNEDPPVLCENIKLQLVLWVKKNPYRIPRSITSIIWVRGPRDWQGNLLRMIAIGDLKNPHQKDRNRDKKETSKQKHWSYTCFTIKGPHKDSDYLGQFLFPNCATVNLHSLLRCD